MTALRFVHSYQKPGMDWRPYKVSLIPTQYVVDADGVVRWSMVGFNGETGDLEKAIRAAL